ncbi:hypothetical protein M2157_002382 [Streptomyces sp. SAI-127]|nr:hypothetical protein [Streptomyces sp. SAI-127]
MRSLGAVNVIPARLDHLVLATPDLDAAVATARARGYDPGEIRPMSRRTPDGTLLTWRLTDGDTQHRS